MGTLLTFRPPALEAPGETCRTCDGPSDNGEGYDGECGTCADKREARREAAEIAARVAASAAARDQERADIERGRALLEAARPAWAVAWIVAELEEDACDYQSDYFNTKTTRTLFLGWSKTTRDSFAEMRKAAALAPETAHLGPSSPPSIEHREKYSMGRGYYLKTDGRYNDGWAVSKKSHNWGLDQIALLYANHPEDVRTRP